MDEPWIALIFFWKDPWVKKDGMGNARSSTPSFLSRCFGGVCFY